MTVQPETRFCCDRCGEEAILPVSSGPAQSRFMPPEGWTTIWVNSTDLQRHLCVKCAVDFTAFMLPIGEQVAT
jgi:hypothetical protein